MMHTLTSYLISGAIVRHAPCAQIRHAATTQTVELRVMLVDHAGRAEVSWRRYAAACYRIASEICVVFAQEDSRDYVVCVEADPCARHNGNCGRIEAGIVWVEVAPCGSVVHAIDVCADVIRAIGCAPDDLLLESD